MPEIFLSTLKSSGVEGDRSSLLSGRGMTAGLNMIYDYKTGSWTPRPTGFRVSPSIGSGLTTRGPGMMLTVPQTWSANDGTLCNLIDWERQVHLQPPIAAGTSFGGATNRLSHVERHQDKYVALIQTGTNVVLWTCEVGGFNGVANTGNFVNAYYTAHPTSAFGRVWYGVVANSRSVQLRWTAANATELTGVGAGSLSLPSSGIIRAIHEISRRLLVVCDDASYLIGSAGGGSPVDPNSAGGVIILDILPGVGTSNAGFSQRVGEKAYILGASGLQAVGVDSFSQKPLTTLLGGPDLQAMSDFYRATQVYDSIIGDPSPPTFNNTTYWASYDALVFSSQGVAVCVQLTETPRVVAWTLRDPLLTQAKDTLFNFPTVMTPSADYLTMRNLQDVVVSYGAMPALKVPASPTVNGNIFLGWEPAFDAYCLFGYTADQNTTRELQPLSFAPSMYSTVYNSNLGIYGYPYTDSPTHYLIYRINGGFASGPTPTGSIWTGLGALSGGRVSGNVIALNGYYRTGSRPNTSTHTIGDCTGSSNQLEFGLFIQDARNVQTILDGFSVRINGLSQHNRKRL